jgi:hypothetical protein
MNLVTSELIIIHETKLLIEGIRQPTTTPTRKQANQVNKVYSTKKYRFTIANVEFLFFLTRHENYEGNGKLFNQKDDHETIEIIAVIWIVINENNGQHKEYNHVYRNC